MYRIAVLGTENSHALAFTRLINRDKIAPELAVTGVYGYDEAANAAILSEFPDIAAGASPDAFLGSVDAVMVTARHGGNHLPYARAYLEAGLPAFIDKPITVSMEDAAELVRIAEKNGAPLCGGSCCGFVGDVKRLKSEMSGVGRLIGGSVTSPVNLDNEYGGFFFYTQHLVQIVGELFGYDVRSVAAVRRESEASALLRYADFDVSAHWGGHVYSAAVYGERDALFSKISIGDGYANEVATFAEMVKTRRMVQDYATFIKPVAILNAVNDAIMSGAETPVGGFPPLPAAKM